MGAVWAEQGTYRFDRSPDPRAGLLDRHSPADRDRVAARRPRVLLHAHRRRSPASSGCAAARSSTRWAGTTTACPPSAACRTTTACAATRRCRTTRPSRRRTKAAQAAGARSAAATSSSCASGSPLEDEQAFEALWRRLGLSVDWTQTYATIDDNVPRRAQRAFLRNLARGEAYQAEAPTLWDVTFRTAVAQAELEDRDAPAPTTGSPSTRADGAGLTSRRPAPSCCPACVALVAHPDDERYQPLFGTTVRTPAVRRRGAGARPPPRRARQGRGIAMICTFGDLTDVTGGASSQLPTRTIIGRDGRITPRRRTWLDARTRRAAYAELAGKTVFSAREAIVELLRESGDLDGEPAPITHPVKFYEKGDKPLEIVTTRQWYIRNGGRDEALRDALLARGARAQLAPRLHAVALRELGRRAQRRLARVAAAVLRRAVPGLVRARRGRRARLRRARSSPAEDVAAGRPVVRRARRLHRRPARRARRLRRRPRHHGHLGHVVAHAADRRRLGHATPTCSRASSRWTCARRARTSSAPGCSRRGAQPPRARLAAVGARRDLRLDPGPRPQEDVEVQGQRRHPVGPARGARLGRGALLGRRPRAWARTPPFDDEPDEDRPPPGDQGPQRLEVRPRPGTRRRPDAAVTRAARSPRCSPSSASVVDRRPPRSRRTTTRGRSRSSRRSSGRSATTTSSWSRSARTAPAATARLPPPHRARARAVDAAAAVRAVPAVRHRRGLVVVARGLGAPGRVADRDELAPRPACRPATLAAVARGRSRCAAQGEVGGQGLDAHRARRRRHGAGPRSCAPASRAPWTTCGPRAGSRARSSWSRSDGPSPRRRAGPPSPRPDAVAVTHVTDAGEAADARSPACRSTPCSTTSS